MTAILVKNDGTKLAHKEFKGTYWTTYPECGGLHIGDASISWELEDIIDELGLEWGKRYHVTITVKVEELEEAKE